MTDSNSKTAPVSSRRRFTQRAGALVGATAASSQIPFIGKAFAQEPMKVGIVFAKQGPFAEQGTVLANGALIALEQIGNKVLGRPIQPVWYDEPNPQGAQQSITKLIEEQKVIAVVGGSNSGSSLAMMSVAKRAKVPFMCANAAAREITGKECNRYTFRTLPTTPVVSRALTTPLMSTLGKKWYFVCASYAWGQDIYATVKADLLAAGGQEVGFDQVPLGTTDFSSFILKVRQAKPDMVLLGITAQDIVNFMKQYKEYGLKDRIPVSCPLMDDVLLWGMGADAAAGYYGKPWHFSDPRNPAPDREFAEIYQKKYGKPAAYNAWAGWITMRMLLSGIDKAQSTDSSKLVEALEQMRLQEGDTPLYYRDWDHQLLRRFLFVKVKPKITGMDYVDVISEAPGKGGDLDAMFGSKQEIGCRMEAA